VPGAPGPAVVASHIDPNLIGPYLVAGPALIGPETRTEALPLSERFRAISVPHQGRLWADLGRAGRIALVGPGRVIVEEATSKRILLHLEHGRLVGRVNPRSGVRLEVEAGGTTVSVVGTVFAVETGADGRVSVLTGKVKVRIGEGRPVPVGAGQSWSAVGARPLSDRSARRMIAEARPFAARVVERGGTLILTGGPTGAQVHLGRSALGTLPLAIRLADGGHTLHVRSPGYHPRRLRVRVVKGKTTRRTVDLHQEEEALMAGEAGTDQVSTAGRVRPARRAAGKGISLPPRGDLARIATKVHASKESLARVRARKRKRKRQRQSE